MSISELDFNVQCHNFVRKCNEFGDCWSLYLSTGGRLRELNFGNMEAVGHQTDGKLMLRKTQVIPVVDTIHTNDFTVIYSESYEVPVLYFCISDRDGSPLSLDEIQGINLDMTNQDLNQVVTQAEHPMLFSPYFMIHPCRTKDIMKLHVAKKGNYLITWLSTLNTLANFGLDSRLFTEDG